MELVNVPNRPYLSVFYTISIWVLLNLMMCLAYFLFWTCLPDTACIFQLYFQQIAAKCTWDWEYAIHGPRMFVCVSIMKAKARSCNYENSQNSNTFLCRAYSKTFFPENFHILHLRNVLDLNRIRRTKKKNEVWTESHMTGVLFFAVILVCNIKSEYMLCYYVV